MSLHGDRDRGGCPDELQGSCGQADRQEVLEAMNIGGSLRHEADDQAQNLAVLPVLIQDGLECSRTVCLRVILAVELPSMGDVL